MNGIRVNDQSFLNLSDRERDSAILAELTDMNRRLSAIERSLSWKWKIQAAITLAGSFLGGWFAGITGGKFPR